MTGAGLTPMRWWQLDQVIAIESDLFGSSAWTREQFYAELAADGRWLQVSRDHSGAIQGYVDVAINDRQSDLMTIAVKRSAQGTGLGTELLQAAMAHAASVGAQHMFLEVRADNPARHLYEALGFTAIDLRRRYYSDGTDAVIMRIRLGRDNGDHAQR